MRFGLSLVLLLIAARPAAAWEPDAAQVATLTGGRPVVQVVRENPASAGLIRGAIDIAAPPEAVWAVILDCDRAPRMVASLKSCRILERDAAGRWDIREHISKGGLLPSLRSIFRSDYDPPRLIRFQRAGGDLKALDGAWSLTPLDGGKRTRVTYENRAVLPVRTLGPVVRLLARRDVEAALLALRRESQKPQ